MIRVPQVRVVDDEGQQLGVMPTHEALRVAQERGYDLVEVAPLAAPPVARFLDYGQFKYEQARRDRDARRHQRAVEFKEIRLSPKIGVGDFDTKVRRAIQFLEAGDRIKVSCRFRGRELTHAYLGRDLLMRFADLVKEHGAVERQPLLEGKSMSIVITSTHKPGTEAKPAEPKPAEARPVEPQATAAEPKATEPKAGARPATQVPPATAGAANGVAARPVAEAAPAAKTPRAAKPAAAATRTSAPSAVPAAAAAPAGPPAGDR